MWHGLSSEPIRDAEVAWRNQSPVRNEMWTFVGAVSDDGIRLAAARLAVGEQRRVVAVERVLQHHLADVGEQPLLQHTSNRCCICWT